MTCRLECYETWHLHAPGSECHHCDPCELDPGAAAERERIRAAAVIHGEGWLLVPAAILEPDDAH